MAKSLSKRRDVSKSDNAPEQGMLSQQKPGVIGDVAVPLAVTTETPHQDPMPISLEQARAAKSEALEKLRRFGEIVGVGITRIGENYAVKVNFRHAPAPGMPTHVHGVPLRVEVTGTLVPRAGA